jgi:hypothetical protein
MSEPGASTVIGAIIGAAGMACVGVMTAAGVLYRSVAEGRRLGSAQSGAAADRLIDRLQARIAALEAQESEIRAELSRQSTRLEHMLGGFLAIYEIADGDPALAKVRTIASGFLGFRDTPPGAGS